MKITFSPSVLIMLCIYFVSGNANRIIMPLSAALIHELGHIVFAIIFSIKIERIELNLFGALIKLPPLACSYKKEAWLAAAGPLSNILFAAISCTFIDRFPNGKRENLIFFAVSSLLFAFINLLPAENFDGGRILSCCLMSKLSPDSVIKTIEFSSVFCIFFLWSISVYFILKTGSYLSLFVFSGALFSRIFLSSDRTSG